MDLPALIPVYASLLVAGLAGSLHCVGMCGPIVLGFSQVFGRTRLTVNGQGVGLTAGRRAAALSLDFLAYHAGRLWTYALLGLVAGFAGEALRRSGAWLGWQKPLSVAVSVAVVVAGVVMLGLIPGLRAERLVGTCSMKQFRGRAWFDALLHGRGALPKLLLGAVMGLLPCGLVYAMLVVVAALPHPGLSALGMVVFGLGTLPALTAVVAVSSLLPAWVRSHGTRIAAVTLIATGLWMTSRSVLASPPTESAPTGSCPACATH